MLLRIHERDRMNQVLFMSILPPLIISIVVISFICKVDFMYIIRISQLRVFAQYEKPVTLRCKRNTSSMVYIHSTLKLVRATMSVLGIPRTQPASQPDVVLNRAT